MERYALRNRSRGLRYGDLHRKTFGFALLLGGYPDIRSSGKVNLNGPERTVRSRMVKPTVYRIRHGTGVIQIDKHMRAACHRPRLTDHLPVFREGDFTGVRPGRLAAVRRSGKAGYGNLGHS